LRALVGAARRIIQFGTSRFLQAHVDLFLHEAGEAGQDVARVTVVQTSGSAERAGRVAAFGQPGGFPVIIRGLAQGVPVERRVMVKSVDRGLSAAPDWAELTRIFVMEAGAVVSNVGESGYDVAAEDRHLSVIQGDTAPSSFPAKLLALFWARWRAGGAPLTVFPCELISHNGQVLRDIVVRLGQETGLPEPFLHWLRRENIWADTLVDRIVSEALEPVGAVAEPYALWAIQRQPGLEPVCRHEAIVMVDDLEMFERLKLNILNLGHTVLAQIWMEEGRNAEEHVRGILQDEAVARRLRTIYDQEVIPGFAAHGWEAQARDYVDATLERFANPYIDHRLSDIAQNHALKITRRIGSFLDWSQSGTVPNSQPQLTTIARAA
jgi:tagaturonate reductase